MQRKSTVQAGPVQRHVGRQVRPHVTQVGAQVAWQVGPHVCQHVTHVGPHVGPQVTPHVSPYSVAHVNVTIVPVSWHPNP